MKSYKSRYAVAKKFQFNPEQMKKLALSYKEAIVKRGIRILDNPYRQLQHAILDVFASWNSEQARIYRHQMHLSDEWGTAVIVQAMVFGNLNEHSGSGGDLYAGSQGGLARRRHQRRFHQYRRLERGRLYGKARNRR